MAVSNCNNAITHVRNDSSDDVACLIIRFENFSGGSVGSCLSFSRALFLCTHIRTVSIVTSGSHFLLALLI